MGLRFFWYRLKMTNPSESEIMPTTILVDVQLQRIDADEHDASLQELRQLIETLGWEIAGALTQKSMPFTQNKSSVVVTGKVCPKLLSSVTPIPVSLLSCEHSRRATFLSPINFSLPSIRPFGRYSRRPNLASSSPTPLVLFETFRMISWPHFDRLSTKRWMLRFYFM